MINVLEAKVVIEGAVDAAVTYTYKVVTSLRSGSSSG